MRMSRNSIGEASTETALPNPGFISWNATIRKHFSNGETIFPLWRKEPEAMDG